MCTLHVKVQSLHNAVFEVHRNGPCYKQIVSPDLVNSHSQVSDQGPEGPLVEIVLYTKDNFNKRPPQPLGRSPENDCS